MNKHATKVLDAYLNSENLAVPHAILIEGRWGSGKTYFLQNVYEPARREQMLKARHHHVPLLFVSLFGATSAHDVEMRIYKAACPGEAVAGSIAGTITLGIGEFFRIKDATKGVVDKLGKKAIKRLNDFVFVFDDLERVEHKAFGEVMGVVNSLISDHGRRVILVADEKKLESLVDGNTWKSQNEKIVGRRAQIEPDFESVIRVSLKSLQNGPAKDLITEKIDELTEIAKTSKVDNLRSLSWAMHNAAAFAACLKTDPDIPDAHILWTMKLVLATTLWMRSGLLDPETLENIPALSTTLAVRSINNRNENSLDLQLEKAKNFLETFVSLSVDTPPVDYSFISTLESSGVLDQNQVNIWIKSHFGFGQNYKEASWRRLWYSHERPLLETEQAIMALKTELASRVYTNQGEILHAVGLSIQQRNANDLRLTANENVVTFFKRYIDDLADKKTLEKLKFSDSDWHYESSYGGLGFSSRETSDFQEIRQHLLNRSQEAALADLQARAERILTEAESGDLDALFQLVHNDDNELTSMPVLKNIPPDRLAKFMATDVPALNAGAKLLAYRYHLVRPENRLYLEIPWARDVYSAVLLKLNDWREPYRTMSLRHLNGTISYYERDKQPEDKIIPVTEDPRET